MPNTALIREVATYIRDHPERYNQSTWFDLERFEKAERIGGIEFVTPENFVHAVRDEPDTMCGTRACVAGTAAMLGVRDHEVEVIRSDFTVWVPNVYDGNKHAETVQGVDFERTGAAALELDPSITSWLFSGGRHDDSMHHVLLRLAQVYEYGVEGIEADDITAEQVLAVIEETERGWLAGKYDAEQMWDEERRRLYDQAGMLREQLAVANGRLRAHGLDAVE